MANKLYEENNIKAIADAIREKNSSTDTYKVEEMAEAVKNLPTGGDDSLLTMIASGLSATDDAGVIDLSKLHITQVRDYFLAKGIRYVTNPASGMTLPSTYTVLLPDSLTSIGDSAFDSCGGLTSISLPDSLTSIGDSAFCSCFGLTSISLPDSLTSIGDSAFFSCLGLTSISLPDSLTSIGDSAFYSCRELTEITIPKNVVNLGKSVLSSCKALTKASIMCTAVTLSYSNYFSSDTALTTIKLNVAGITGKGFALAALTKVWIGANCTTITGSTSSNGVFQGATALTDIYCEADKAANNWDYYWNYTSTTTRATVHWGVTEAEFDALDDTTDTTDATETA